jgi:YfiH family protein
MPAVFLESQLLRKHGFRHAFFTRTGGTSSGPFESLNFSVTVGDAPESVRRNFGLGAEALGVSADNLFFLSQVHGCGAVELPVAARAEEVMRMEGDALASARSGLAVSVRTADCVPILAGDPATGAVVAIHAGWRGVVRGVVEAGIELVAARSHAPSGLVVAIGPHIRKHAFEVSEDVASELEAASTAREAVDRTGLKPHVSLVNIVTAKLIALGVDASRIDDVGGCTASEPERFFSFRRDGKVGGRHLSAIVPR